MSAIEITLQPTDAVILHGSTPVRIWHGADAQGVPLLAMVAGLQLQTQDPEAIARYDGALEVLEDAEIHRTSAALSATVELLALRRAIGNLGADTEAAIFHEAARLLGEIADRHGGAA